MSFVREILIEEVSAIPDDTVAALLSGGMDSLSVALAAREAGKTVVAYSFTLDGWVSSDFADARRRAEQFGWKFRPVFLPRDVKTLQRDLINLVAFGARKKTDFECGWPVVRAIQEVKERVIISGHGSDGHFCISKKGLLHYRDRIDEFRDMLFGRPGYSQKPILDAFAASIGKELCFPFFSPRMIAAFRGKSWDEVNRPKQKQPILDTFPAEFARAHQRPHQSLQLGDSKIAEHFKCLLATEWSTTGAKTPVGIYNRLARGDYSATAK